jgi:hypothetical protein
MRVENAIALSCALLTTPFATSFADVESDTLHGNTYQDSAFVQYCSDYGCNLSFAPTTHDTTAITMVSCSFTVDAAAQVNYLQLLAKSNPGQVENVPFYYVGSGNVSSGYLNFATNAQVQFFIKKGDTPVISLSLFKGSVSSTLLCFISGYHS